MPARIPTETLLDDLQRVADIVDGVPSYYDYKEHGEYSLRPIKDRFGGIVAAREAAGVGEGDIHGREVSKGAVLADLKKVAAKLGKPPSWTEYNEHGGYSAMLVSNKFGGLEAARRVAGLTDGPSRPERIPSEALLSDLQRIADIVEGAPSQSDLEEYGEFSLRTYIRRFGSWSAAIREAGMEPNPTTPQGADNHAWKGGVSHNYSTKEWREQRQKALERDNYQCQKCGVSNEEHVERYGRGIDVHHITAIREVDRVTVAHRVENLITLCRPHHREYEELPANECEKLKES